MSATKADPRPYLNPNNGERTSFPHAASEYKPRGLTLAEAKRSTSAGDNVYQVRRRGDREGVLVTDYEEAEGIADSLGLEWWIFDWATGEQA